MCILAVDVEDSYVPVGIGSVILDANGEPDTLLRYKKVRFQECDHFYWAIIAPNAEALVEQLDQYVLWRGPFARTGETLIEWFMHNVHEGQSH